MTKRKHDVDGWDRPLLMGEENPTVSLRKDAIAATKIAEFRGEVICIDKPTHGGRIYPRPVVVAAVAKIQTKVKDRSFFGGLFPVGMEYTYSLNSTSLSKLSHVVTDLQFEENGDLMATVEIMATKDGEKVAAMLEANKDMLGLATRGIGSVRKDECGIDIVQPDFEIISIDFCPVEKRAW